MDTEKVKKAFYKSKAFWGCVSTIVLIAGDIASNGVTLGSMMALTIKTIVLTHPQNALDL